VESGVSKIEDEIWYTTHYYEWIEDL